MGVLYISHFEFSREDRKTTIEATIKLRAPFQFIVAQEMKPDEALDMLMQAASDAGEVPREHWPDGTPIIHVSIAVDPPAALMARMNPKIVAIMETKPAN